MISLFAIIDASAIATLQVYKNMTNSWETGWPFLAGMHDHSFQALIMILSQMHVASYLTVYCSYLSVYHVATVVNVHILWTMLV